MFFNPNDTVFICKTKERLVLNMIIYHTRDSTLYKWFKQFIVELSIVFFQIAQQLLYMVLWSITHK